MLDLTGTVRKIDNHYFAFGGHADVWRGEWTTDTEFSKEATTLVIKVIRSTKDDPEKLKSKLMREGWIWHTLNHTNITPFFGVAFDLDRPSMPSLICPYYSNGDLPTHLLRHPETNRLLLVSQIAAGLVYLHHLQPPIIHGDIKGTNILINDKGEASITDFGVSRILETSGFTTSSTAGTCRWMAPELLGDGDDDATSATDVWAFAMTAIEIFTGRIPFHRIKRDAAVIKAIMTQGRPIREQNPEIPDDVWSILQICWNDEPTARPSTTSLALFFDIAFALSSSHPDSDIATILYQNAITAITARSANFSRVHSLSSGCSVLSAIDHLRHGGSGYINRAYRWFPLPWNSSESEKESTANIPPLPYRCNWQECSEGFETLSECQTHELDHLRRPHSSREPTVGRLEYVSLLSTVLVAVIILSWFLPLCCKHL